jgi:hypothetical protein
MVSASAVRSPSATLVDASELGGQTEGSLDMIANCEDPTANPEHVMAQLNPVTQAVLIMIFVTPLVAFWLWMFRDMLENRHLVGNTRNFWLFALLFLNVFGAAMYYANEYLGRKR